MSLHEIVLPETKPETEWVRGRALQKTGGVYRHARLQCLWGAALAGWAEAGDHGRVAIEWRFRVTPPGGITRPLVPDLAYLSYDAVPADAPAGDFELPRMAPTVAIEILAPEDLRADVEDKIATYLAAGARRSSSSTLTPRPSSSTTARARCRYQVLTSAVRRCRV